MVVLFVGLVAGWLAGQIVRGTGFGIVGDLIIGILGAFIGSWLLPQLGIHLGRGIISAIVNATIGAVLLLFVVRLLRGGGGWGSRWRGRLGVTHARVSATARAFAARATRTLNFAPDRLQMKNFSNASFPPETIAIMKVALDRAVASLPDLVSSAHVQAIAETILRTAKDGERDPAILQRLALMELQILTRC